MLILYIVFLAVALPLLVGMETENVIRWIPASYYRGNLLVPAGFEMGKTGMYQNYYVARVKNATNWIPGKFCHEIPGRCWVGVNGRQWEKPEDECEILIFPKGTTSWIHYASNATNSTLPDNIMIRGGMYHGNQENTSATTIYPLYTCRARRQGQLLIGRLSLNYLKRKPQCYTTFNGMEYKDRDFEVLVTNYLARVTNTTIQD